VTDDICLQYIANSAANAIDVEESVPVDDVSAKLLQDAVAAAEASAALVACRDRQIEALMARMNQLEKSVASAAAATAAQSRAEEAEGGKSKRVIEHSLGEAMSGAFKGQPFKKQRQQFFSTFVKMTSELAVLREREFQSNMESLFYSSYPHDSD
jgi:type IV secretory pathway VirB10-like protein